MAHTLRFTVTVELERESGKFAPRDEMADFIIGELEGVDPGTIDGIGADGESSYTVNSWGVEYVE
jgi:hypothetical protein